MCPILQHRQMIGEIALRRRGIAMGPAGEVFVGRAHEIDQVPLVPFSTLREQRQQLGQIGSTSVRIPANAYLVPTFATKSSTVTGTVRSAGAASFVSGLDAAGAELATSTTSGNIELKQQLEWFRGRRRGLRHVAKLRHRRSRNFHRHRQRQDGDPENRSLELSISTAGIACTR